MQRRGLVAAVLIALGLPAGLWFALRDGEPDGSRPATPAGARPKSAAAPIGTVPAPIVPSAGPSPAVAEDAPRASLDAAAPSGDGLGLRTLSRSTGEAVPGAEVYALGAAELPAEDRERFAPGWELARPDQLERYEALLSERGRALRSDENGTLWLARPAGELLLLGRAPGLPGLPRLPHWIGAMRVDARSESPVRFLLEDCAALEVRVRDAGGAPLAGVPVALRADRWPGDADEHARAISAAPEGVARFPRAGWILGSAPGAFWYAAVDAVVAEPVERRVGLDALGGPPIELRLPPTGSVEVRLHDEDGRRATRAVELELAAAGSQRSVALVSQDGAARFPWVEAGLELQLLAVGWPREHDRFPFRAHGPEWAGATAVIELGTASAAWVTLRLVDESGAPIADAHVTADFATGKRRDRTAARSDSAGGLRLAPPLAWLAAPDRVLAVAEARPGRRAGRVQPAPASGPGDHPLGDLCLALPPVVAAGRVVDTAGAGIAGALVHAGTRAGSFRPDAALDVEADAEGAFEVRGTVAGPTLALACESAGASAEAELPVGTTGARIVLAPQCRARGRVLLPERAGSDGIRVLVPRGAPGAGSTSVAGLRRDGTFELLGLAPGWQEFRVDLGAAPAWSKAPGLVQSAELRAGETTELPPFDLRGLAAPIELRIADGGVRAASGATVAYWPSHRPPETQPKVARADRGRLRLPGSDAPYELAIHAPGFALARLSAVGASREVELEPAIALRLLLCGIDGAPAISAGLGFQLELVRGAEGADLLPTVHAEAARQGRFDARGEARVSVPCSGRYRVWACTPQGVPIQLAGEAGAEGRCRLEFEVRVACGSQDVELWGAAETLRRLARQPTE